MKTTAERTAGTHMNKMDGPLGTSLQNWTTWVRIPPRSPHFWWAPEGEGSGAATLSRWRKPVQLRSGAPGTARDQKTEDGGQRTDKFALFWGLSKCGHCAWLKPRRIGFESRGPHHYCRTVENRGQWTGQMDGSGWLGLGVWRVSYACKSGSIPLPATKNSEAEEILS